MPSKTLIIATKNRGKFKEIEAFFSPLALKLQCLHDFPQLEDIPETGTTFTENALIKARAVHRICKSYVLADDSGLVCDDLHGEPGVYSARYSGANANDESNNQKLLEEMKKIENPGLQIRYVCAMALISPEGEETVFKETCEGHYIFEPRGDGGFGYDPYFYLPAYHGSMAEIDLETKNKISHRGKALLKVKDHLGKIKF